MTIRTTLVAIAARCDGPHCTREVTATGVSLAAARADLKTRGWTVTRTAGYEQTLCPACAADWSRLITAGIIGKDGLVRDLPAFDAWLASRT